MDLDLKPALGIATPHRTPGHGLADAAVIVLTLLMLLLAGLSMRHMVVPFTQTVEPRISLSPLALPAYALWTTTRMLLALAISLLFTLVYATLAAKSRRAEILLIPLLDVLQSVPVLGYLSFTVAFFLAAFPHRALGPELAAIFAIFTSQAWNMTFSFYQALKTVPHDLDDASRSFNASPWQRFWQLEVPFAVPGLVWNMMMSMSGAWFFVVASEAIAVGDTQITLPGIGAYVAAAIQARHLTAIGWAVLAMIMTIFLYDQLLFRPMVAWADRFRFEQTAATTVASSWVLDLLRRSQLMQHAAAPMAAAWHAVTHARLAPRASRKRPRAHRSSRWLDALGYALATVAAVYLAMRASHAVEQSFSWEDLFTVLRNGGITLLRVVVLVILASLIWVPIGVMVGLRPALTEKIQPLVQFLAAFPANLLFPLAVFLIVRGHLAPGIWLSPLMIFGTQWYILFNVIAGASAYPSDLREAAACFRIRHGRWWKDVMLPGVFPYYVTGAVTASGGAWNASIVAEWVRWGPRKLDGGGLGAYIARMTEAGDYPHIALGIVVMAALVIAMNTLLWRPLHGYAQRHMRLD